MPWLGTRCATSETRRNLASTLLVPESKIRVIKPKVGGGFGGKIDMFAKDFCAAWFAMKLGRPVKFVYDREEVFMGTRQRHPMYVTVKTGMMKDGTIHAQRFWAYADGGAGWKEKRGKLPYGRGVGLGGASFPSGVSNMSHLASGAIVQIGQDGAVNVLTGAADIGQGAETVIGQIVAEEIGVPLEDVRVTAADTGITPLDSGTFGSGVTVRAGNAAWEAAAAAKRKLFEFIAPRFGVGPEDLAARDRKIFVKNNPEKGLRFLDALKDYRYADLPMPIIGRGSWMAPAIVNAIYDAIGIDFNELPITPEKILKKLEKKRTQISRRKK